MGGEGFGEVGGVSVEVVRVAAVAPHLSGKGIRDLSLGRYGVATVVVALQSGTEMGLGLSSKEMSVWISLGRGWQWR